MDVIWHGGDEYNDPQGKSFDPAQGSLLFSDLCFEKGRAALQLTDMKSEIFSYLRLGAGPFDRLKSTKNDQNIAFLPRGKFSDFGLYGRFVRLLGKKSQKKID